MIAEFHIPEPFRKDFKTKVNVSTQGLFTTMIPSDIAQLFLDHEVHLATNRVRNPGYFSSNTLRELKEQIGEKIEELCSEEEEVSRERVIKYSIDTACSYAIPKDGRGFLPNCVGRSFVDDIGWRGGAVTRHASLRGPYGFWMYAKPFEKVVYKYTSTGRERIVYTKLGTHLFSGDPRENALEWLAALSLSLSLFERSPKEDAGRGRQGAGSTMHSGEPVVLPGVVRVYLRTQREDQASDGPGEYPEAGAKRCSAVGVLTDDKEEKRIEM